MNKGIPSHGTSPLRALATVWLAGCVVLAALATGASAVTVPFDDITRLYFVRHDLPAAALVWGLLLAADAVASRWSGPLAYIQPSGPRRLVLWASFGAACLAYAGTWLVFERHALSGDELMAVFDTSIFRHGRLYADVSPEWRPFVPALQPIFRLSGPDNAWWVSGYLPVNALLRSVFARVGDPALAGPVWAGLSILLVYAVGRRLRPDRPALAVTAAVLLATSSQLLITAMTPFAMSAHLALNLLWLWLILRSGAAGHLAAVAVAFAATGLHQLIFHPLFAAPFVLALWLQRRWGAATLHTAAYAVIGLFWASYWGVAFPTPPAATEFGSASGWIERAVRLLLSFEPAAFGEVGANLFRFMVWQNPLVIPLLLTSGLAAHRAGAWPMALSGGLVLTVLTMLLLLPHQGQGWGYRYLHGLLGNACLLAALGWLGVLDRLAAGEKARAWTVLALVSAVSLLVLLPLRAWQARNVATPYAAAARAIGSSDAEIVLVDASGFRFGHDLVRNDPFLRNRPKVMLVQALTSSQLEALCRSGRIALFDRRSAAAFGLRRLPDAAVTACAFAPPLILPAPSDPRQAITDF